MFDALIFSTVNALEFLEVRGNAIRIPEVFQRVRQAQEIWDRTSDRSLDLANFIGADDRGFLGNLRLKNLATAVVQVGLLDRVLKNYELPRFLVGLSNGDSPVKVAARQQTFENLIQESQAMGQPKPSLVSLQPNGLPILSGISLAEFTLLERQEHGYEPLLEGEMDFKKIISELAGRHKVSRLLVVGPGPSHVSSQVKQMGATQVEVVDSVGLDPLLSWFWSPGIETRKLSVAMQ